MTSKDEYSLGVSKAGRCVPSKRRDMKVRLWPGELGGWTRAAPVPHVHKDGDGGMVGKGCYTGLRAGKNKSGPDRHL